jgi:hypothetical protein
LTDDSYENAAPPAGSGGGSDISTITIEDELKRSYLDYAMSVIVSRALPDARDGSEAGAPPHPVFDARPEHDARAVVFEVRARGR